MRYLRGSGPFFGAACVVRATGGLSGRSDDAVPPQATEHDEIVHVLNRITFGPRPGDVEKVEKMGLSNYIQQQLHPETIDDSAVEQQVSQFELWQMSSQELSQLFLEERKQNLEKQKRLAANKLAATTSTVGQPVTP